MARRALTAICLLAAFFAAILLLPRGAFAVLVAIPIALGALEWARLCGLARGGAAFYAGTTVAAYGVAVLEVLHAAGGGPAAHWMHGVASAFWVVAAPVWLAAGVRASARPVLLLAGPVALVPAACALVILAPARALLVLGLVWVADTAAYLAGRRFGRRKLAPTISPGKTWEGVGGALLAVLAYAIICGLAAPAHTAREAAHGWGGYLAASIVLCAVSIVGDLFESGLKRQAMAKDSGSLLPGHGGVLDRIDSALAALPVAALMFAATSD